MNVVAVANLPRPGHTIGCGYDTHDALNTEAHSTGGNLLSKTTGGATIATESFTYDDRNRMLSDTVVGVSTNSYSYNDQGDQTAVNSNLVVWDDNSISGYSQELDENGTGMASGPMGVNVQCNTSLGYLLSDGHNSTRFVTDASGNPQTTYLYDAFGGQLNPAATGPFATNVPHTGQYFRPGGGSLYDLRARMYDPSVGRFSTTDTYRGTLRDPRSLNKFVYGNDNPANTWDPSGKTAGTLIDFTVAIGIAVLLGGLLLAATHPHLLPAPSISLPEIPSLSLPYADESPYITFKNLDRAKHEELQAEAATEIEAAKTENGVDHVLYHYTADLGTCLTAVETGYMVASGEYRNARLIRPAGVWATDISPADESYTKNEITDYFGVQNPEYCIIIGDDDQEFQFMGFSAYVKRAPAGSLVPVNAIYFIVNPQRSKDQFGL